jgi:hypothetical protein
MLYTRYLLPVLILFASAFYVVATPVHHVELVACAERQPEVSVLGVVTDQLDILKKLSNKIRDWISQFPLYLSQIHLSFHNINFPVNQEVKAATTKLASEIVPQVIGSYTKSLFLLFISVILEPHAVLSATQYLAYAAYIDDEKISEQIAVRFPNHFAITSNDSCSDLSRM